jgi:methionyl-tRNA formyltransferase
VYLENKFTWGFVGYGQIGYDALNLLIAKKEKIAFVVTHKRQEKTQEGNELDLKKNIEFDDIAFLSKKHTIPLFYVDCHKDLEDLFPTLLKISQEMPLDFLLSVYFRLILKEDILKLAQKAALNIHGSLLPKYRGRCPVNWAIIHGETETGCTLHHMVSNVDEGDIVDQKKVSITITDNAGSVMQKINKASQSILERQLSFFQKGIINKIPQEKGLGFYVGKRTRHDSRINWNNSALDIYNFIRALQPKPLPPAFSTFQNQEFDIIEASLVVSKYTKNLSSNKPGTLIAIYESETDLPSPLLVLCKNSETLLLTRHNLDPSLLINALNQRFGEKNKI